MKSLCFFESCQQCKFITLFHKQTKQVADGIALVQSNMIINIWSNQIVVFGWLETPLTPGVCAHTAFKLRIHTRTTIIDGWLASVTFSIRR